MNKSVGQGASGPSRREFLKSSSVAAAALAGSLSIARSAHAASDETIKIGLIGCGGRGTGACGQALSTQGPVKLIAMADAFRDRLDGAYNHLSRTFKDRVDVPEDHKFVGFDAYQRVIEAGPDLVVIATPPGFRPIHFEAAVNANKNVFAEKPVATDAGGVRRFLAAAAESKKKNLKVGIGLQRHHQTGYKETVARLHDGAIGDILDMRVYWNGQTPWKKPRQPGQSEMEYQMRNWYYFTWLCGDNITEQHIHNLDVANWVLQGHPVKANGMGGFASVRGKDDGEKYDHFAIEYEYANGARVFSQCRQIPGCWDIVDEFAVGTKGTAKPSGLIEVGGKKERFGGGKDPYQVEHDDLFAAVRENRPYNEAEYGAHSTMTSILGRMCAYSGQVLTWDEAINSKIDLMPKEYSWQAAPPTLPDENGYYALAIPGKTKVV